MSDTAKLFRNGNSQAVRLPKAYRFEGQAVRISRLGRGVLLEPLEAEADPWAGPREAIGQVSADFMEQREQPPMPPDRDPGFN
ncbi:MAG: antitoxin [Rhodothalassiaceae bacterium]